MTYTRPTLAEFQAILPGFPAATEAQYDYWAARAERVVTDAFGDDQAHGTMLLTAHYLVTQGLGSGTDSQRWSRFAGANRVKSGSLELGWSDGSNSTGSSYGDAARALILAVKGGPCVAGTGAFPPTVDYGGLR